ncbi:Gag-Pol polyprotein [Thelohanellus kitauei]|uniref:Gag-Pol polyprotein n=1 Tax=Thelohanellus kitauei TaxID=669202 RepID=A0A0C2IY20_THEKT|nr:Gag-Pol polyprotein [Thelohanellus kitauei]
MMILVPVTVVMKNVITFKNMGYWPGMYVQAHEFCQQCEKCAEESTKSPHIPSVHLLGCDPWESVSVDILESSPSGPYRYILATQDYFTKWLIALPLQRPTAELFAYFGLPKILHSYQGRNFEAHVFQKLCLTSEIQKTRTTSFHKQGNGLVERANRTIINILRKVANNCEWHNVLPLVTYSYSCSAHSTTWISPYEALFGRKPRNRVWDLNNKVYDFRSKLYQTNLTRVKLREIIEQESNVAECKNKEHYDSLNKALMPVFDKGQRVLRQIRRTCKIDPIWQRGWKVEEDRGNTI